MNIEIKPNNVISFKENDYFLNSLRVLSDAQIIANTDKGNVLLDLTCTINGVSFSNITDFCNSFGATIINEPTQEELIAQKEAELLAMYNELKALKGEN